MGEIGHYLESCAKSFVLTTRVKFVYMIGLRHNNSFPFVFAKAFHILKKIFTYMFVNFPHSDNWVTF